MNKLNILFYVAAVTTAIAGIIHVILGIPSNNQNMQILFVAGGLLQIFWIIPMLRKWGNVWYGTGLGGTIVFIAIWGITRIPDNFITGRGGRISDNGILTEVFQIAFVVIVIAIFVLEKKTLSKKEEKDR
ncbi:hypothetical protein [Nitrosopumilus sp.]|uniref:hypothetical protein n=1 Tax=Nitrosopumilus sp. TaxID=2024843 RepID=UPI00247D12B7|nr:hypothetical protein [Nitrosopumilus sp.]MCV0431858.1 hypothetical protein [Nitrosopumilus sp.]